MNRNQCERISKFGWRKIKRELQEIKRQEYDGDEKKGQGVHFEWEEVD